MLRSAKFILSLGAALIVAGVANAAPKEAASEGKVCEKGVGKPFVMPLFANGKAVSACEVGNGGFFGKSCAQPGKLAASTASASGCCAGEKAAVKVAKSEGCGEKGLGVMACEVGNRHFFTASSCGESAAKVAKSSCCSAK